MKFFKLFSSIFILIYPAFSAFAQQPELEPVDFAEIAEKQADAFQQRFHLDAAQVFRIDSLFQHDLPLMDEEMANLRKAGMMNSSTYQAVSDKWMDIIDKGIEKIFTKEQWTKYMKSVGGKEKIKRDKRMAKAKNTQNN